MGQLILVASLLTVAACSAATAEPFEGLKADLLTARRNHDDKALTAVQSKLLKRLGKLNDNFHLRLLTAESYLLRADLLRNSRQTRTLSSRTVAGHRKRQTQWSIEAIPHAEKAIELASGKPQRAQAERVLGELFAHQSSETIVGLFNGSKALDHLQEALFLAPRDPEVNRAIGLMYLSNPPTVGGDLDAAIKTFRQCVTWNPREDRYRVLLSLAFRKKGKLLRAELSARKAVMLNSKNQAARHLLEDIRANRKVEES